MAGELPLIGAPKKKKLTKDQILEQKFDFYNNGDYYTLVRTKMNNEPNIEIPEEYCGKPVKVVGEHAFAGHTEIETLSMSDSVTTICGYAFSGCSSLASITIPDSVTGIGNYAFSGCSGLSSITISNSVTSIGNSAFYGCSGLTSITIPSSVTDIGNYAFSYCSGLSSIIISNSVTGIDSHAFSGCSGLTSITIPSSVTSIAGCAFSGCTNLATLTLEKYPNSMGNDVFYNCPIETLTINGGKVQSYFSGKSTITSLTLGERVTSIYSYAFEGCIGITSITIPNSVTSIEYGAFRGCSGLESITVSEGNTKYHSSGNCLIETSSKKLVLGCKNSVISTDGSVNSINSSAFHGCSSLTSITIPNSVTSIESDAFSGCTNLATLTLEQYPSSLGYDVFNNCPIETLTINAGEVGDYFKDNSTITSLTIGEGVTSIEYGAFRGCGGLESITVAEGNTNYHSSGNCLIETTSKILMRGGNNSVIPTDGRVSSVGYSAFYGCSGLTSITIPNSVTSIDFSAFSGCGGLESITVAEGNTKYHSSRNCLIETTSKTLMRGCKNSVIPTDGSVTSVGYSAFSGCSGLETITIPSSVTYIVYGAFSGCSDLESITVSEGNTEYHSSGNCLIETERKKLIAGCKTSVIPTDGSVTSIGDYAFSGCSALTSITIPSSVTDIGNYAFSGCSGLTSITIPDSVTSISCATFRDCSGLTSITIPSSVTIIGDYAFSGCTSLATITFASGINWNSIWISNYYTFYCTPDILSFDVHVPDQATGNVARTKLYKLNWYKTINIIIDD